jgi:Chorismate mutase type II.
VRGDKSDTLENLRGELNSVTAEIVTLLRRRLELCRRVQSAKQAAGAPTLDLAREEEIVSKLIGGG